MYSHLLGVSGKAYELRSGSDQKCLAESGAITDAAFDMISKSGADGVVVVGDLTNDGEKCSHTEILKKLNGLNKNVPVYAVTSTHDWCSDGKARRYDGGCVFTDVETVSPDTLGALYGKFGRKNEISSYKTSKGFVSRSFKVSDKVRLILVNDDCGGSGGKSGYSDEHLEWVENQAREGTANGEFVIAAQHHLVLPCFSNFVNASQLISDGEKIAARLADAGVRLLFVGHSHMLRATKFVSPNGNTLTQINLSALCGWPAGITYVTVKEKSAEIRTESVSEFTYNGEKYDAEYIKNHTANVLMNVINSAVNDRAELADRLRALGINVHMTDKMYSFIKKCASFVSNVTVGKAAHALNAVLPLGGKIDAKAIAVIKNDKLTDYIIKTFLSVFDGSRSLDGCPDAVRGVLVTIANKITAYARSLPVTGEKRKKTVTAAEGISQALKEIALPGQSPDTEVYFE